MSIFSFIRLTICIVMLSLNAIGLLVPPSFAKINNETRTKALEVARLIERENLVITKKEDFDIAVLSALPPVESIRDLRRLTINAIIRISNHDSEVLAKLYLAESGNYGTVEDKTHANLLSEFVATFDANDVQSNKILLEDTLLNYTRNDYWYTAHTAWQLLSLLESYDFNTSLALEYAQNAQLLIPNQITSDTQSARIVNTSHIAYLHNLMNNPRLAVENTELLIELQRENGVETDGSGLINNMIVAFSGWRDYETARDLGEILLRLEEQAPSTVPGLTEMRLAEIYVELADYNKAMPLINTAMQVTEHELIQANLNILLAIAKAGLSDLSGAKRSLEDFRENTTEDIQNSGSLARHKLKADAMIAMVEGRLSDANRLNSRLMAGTVQDILSTNSQDTAELLATLQNSKERQDEREQALRTEANLREVALERQKNVNRLLFLVVIVTAMLALVAFFFARNTQKSARQLAIVADKARASEKAKSEFLAIISHELRTPLNGIIGMADFLNTNASSPDVRKKNNVILNSGYQLLGLVENILDTTLIENGEITVFPEMIEIRPLIKAEVDHWKPIIEEKGIIFTAHIDPSVPDYFETDPRRFKQCISNLLSNASKFTSKGRIHFHSTAKNITADQTDLSIIVADTGNGISEDAKSRLFKPFVQADTSSKRKYGGTGLGLAITRALARMLNGDVTVHSRAGRGSEFNLILRGKRLVQLNTTDNSMTRKPKNLTVHENQPEIFAPGHALVVDDDATTMDVMKAILEPNGWSLTYVKDGSEALRVLAEHPYDIILMDFLMPKLDGLSTTRTIRHSSKSYADIPIISVTADVAETTREKCRMAGMNMFLEKPLSARALIEAINQVRYNVHKSGLKQSA